MKFFLLLIVVSVLGCKQNATEPVTPPEPKPTLKGFEPPAVRTAAPVKLLDLRLKEKVGTFTYEGKTRDLVGFGLNLCQTGYVAQGFLRDEAGVLEAGPTFRIPRAGVAGEVVTLRAPTASDTRVRLDFETFSLAKVKGTLTVLADGKVEVMRYDVDAEPTTVVNMPGLGQQGCYTTGEFAITTGDRSIRGPVTAVFDNKTLYVVVAQLTERHQIMWHIDLRPHLRQKGSLIRGDLARIAERPDQFPFRVSFIERTDDREKTPTLVTHETMATQGEVGAAWHSDTAEGPVRISIDDLVMPKWEGPWSEQTVSLKIEAKFVTDERGMIVPLPAQIRP